MSDSKASARYDTLVERVHDWVESAVALDEGHFPSELVSDLKDLIDELKEFLEEEKEFGRDDLEELFVTPEMAEVIERFPKVRRLMEQAWGTELVGLIREEAAGFGGTDEDEDDE